LRAGT